jgi:glycosyltransferase involved in cell wall biosynthesis
MGHQSTLFVGRRVADEPGVIEIPYVRGIPGSRRIARWIEGVTGWQDIYNPSFKSLLQEIPADTDIVHFHNLWGGAGYADISALPALTARWPCVLTEHQNWSLTGHCACFHDCARWQTGCGACPRLDLPPAVPRDGTRFSWRRKRRIIQSSRVTFVGISDYVCNLAHQSPIWQGKRVERIYNGVDMEKFCPVDSARRQELRTRLGIAGEKIAVLVTGQTLGGYREGIATEGLAALNQLKHLDIVPLLVGHIAAEAASRLEAPPVLVPYRETEAEMAECYQAADIALVTSHVEAFGRAAAESQACGTPVVAFSTGGLAEVVLDGVGGRSVKSRDLESLVSALADLVDNRESRLRLGVGGTDFVRENFDSARIARQYEELYGSLLQGSQTH